MFAVIGVLAALLHRSKTGEGQLVDVAMYDSMVALNDAGINYWSMGLGRGGDAPLINHAFPAKDGYFVLQVLRRRQFELLAETIGHPQWIADPALLIPAQWVERLDEVIRPAVVEWASIRTKLQAALELGRAGIAAEPVQTQAEVASDEHLWRRNMIIESPRVDGVAQPILSPGNPVKMSKMADARLSRVPWCGEHTDEVLGTELGLDRREVARMREAGIIGAV